MSTTTPTRIEPDPELLELALRLARIEAPSHREGMARLRALAIPLAMADDDDDAGGDDDAGDDDDDAKDKGKSGDNDDDDDAGDADLEAARKALAKTNAENRRLKKAAEDAKTKAAAEAGQWKELYEEEKKKREELEREQEEGQKTRLAEAALTRLKARNPSRYVRLLDLDGVDDDASAERAAKRLLKSDPHLFDTPSTRQKRGAADDAGDDDDDDKQDRKDKRPVNRLRRGLDAAAK